MLYKCKNIICNRLQNVTGNKIKNIKIFKTLSKLQIYCASWRINKACTGYDNKTHFP